MKVNALFKYGVLVAFLALVSTKVFAAERYDIGTPTLTDIYLSPTGNDNNNGLTPTTALQGIKAAWTKMQSTGFNSSGYNVKFLPGSYNGEVYLDTLHASFTKPVIFSAANGPGTVTFNGNIQFYQVSYVYLKDISIVNGGDAFHCEQCDHFLLKNMVIDGGNRQAQETVKVNQSQYIYIEDSDIQGAYDNPIDMVSVQYGHAINNKIHNGEDWCFYTKGGSAYFIVEGNEMYNCGTGGFTTGQGTGFEYMVQPWITYEAINIKVMNNIIHDVEGAALGVNGGYNILMAHNTAYRVGSRSHVLEFVYGGQECDGNISVCQQNYNLGGWGNTTSTVFKIPNKNVFVYNNIIYNPPGFQSAWQQIEIAGPSTNPAGNAPRNIVADENLQIRGNIIWNGSASMPLGVGDTTCSSNNPTCNVSQLLSENDFNTIQPQLVNPTSGDFRPVSSGNIFSNAGYTIPSFNSADLPPLSAAQGDLVNTVLKDRDSNLRGSLNIPGAYSASNAASPTSTDLQITESDTPDPAIVGNRITYTIALQNNGSIQAQNVTMNGTLNGASIDTVNTSIGSCSKSGNNYNCQIGNLNPGSTNITLTAQTSTTTNLELSSSVSSTTSDTNPSNNSYTERTSVAQDSDMDGILDTQDNCVNVANPGQADMDRDGIGDACDSDLDGDTIINTLDNCPNTPNTNQADLDRDGIGDSCDSDLDGDQILNTSDNCPNISNANQADADHDGIGDTCDNCPSVANTNQADSNRNGVGDACEVSAADLTGTWSTQANQTCSGSGTTLSCTITGVVNLRNIGNKSAGSSTVSFYLSTNNTFESSDTLLKSTSTSSLAIGANRNISLSKTLSRGQSTAGKYVIAVFDSGNVVSESNENNNKIASNPIPGAMTSYTASGRIVDASSIGMSGVSLTFSLVSGSATVPTVVNSDSNGNWSASGFVGGVTYRVTPSKTNTNFSPASLDFSTATTSLNFTASPVVVSSGNIIPNIDASMKTRLQGILSGGTKNRAAFSKIGDSITESGSFLIDIGCGSYDLGTYTNLGATIDYFMTSTFAANSPSWCGGRGNSFNRASISATAGWTTDSALAVGACGEANFRCEIKATNAGFAYIMYGTNDLERYNDTTRFQTNLSQIVSESISLGTVPILSTIPSRQDSADLNSRVAAYNQVVNQVAASYQIPVVNYWQALQNLGATNNYGISSDGVHPSTYNNDLATLFTSAGMNYGYNVRNLTFLQMMEKMKRIVIENGTAD